MGEVFVFYRRWLAVAFHGALDRTAFVAFLVLSLIDGSKHFYPRVGEVTGTLVWAIPYWALALVMVWRMLAAPFVMWREDKVSFAQQQDAQVGPLLEKIARLTAPKPDSIYQHGREVGTVTRHDKKISEGVVIFDTIVANGEFNPNASFEYHDLTLRMSSCGASSLEKSMGVIQKACFAQAVCNIIGRL